MRKVVLILFMVVSIHFALPAMADAPRVLQWDDLVPRAIVFDDLLAQLTAEQRVNIAVVARVRKLQAQQNSKLSRQNSELSPRSVKRMQQLTEKLEKQGIDTDSLLARIDEVIEKRRAQTEAVVDDLDGQNIRLPGYLLPLEFEGTKVIEFLLVPYVGACIHVPPPPPNQIVHVRLSEGYESPGLFSPVWVNGTIATQRQNTELWLVDGSADIAVGYSLRAELVEPYE